MSFSNLRGSSPLYILNKEGVPTVNIGSVVNVTAPVPKWGVPMAFGQPQEMVVDLTVKVEDKQGQFFKVPAGDDVYEYENNGVKTPYVLAASRDAINAEVSALRQQAVGVLNSVEYNKQVVAACDDMLRKLNPEFAEKQRQEEEISELKRRFAEQQAQMAELISLLKGKEAPKEERPAKNK